LLELYPDDPEAEYLLGEILYHTGFAVGRAAADAMPMFQHVAAQEPANVEALAHLARLSASTGNVIRVDTLARRVAELRPAGDRLALELEILARMAEGNRPALRRIMDKNDASRTRDDILYLATWRVAATTDSTEIASAFGWRLLDRSTNPDLRLRTRTRLAEYAVNAGRLTRALQIASDENISLLGFRGYLVSLPFAGAKRATLLAYADSLDAWRPAASNGAMTELALAANGASRRLVAFPRGLLAIRLGDLAGARRAQQELTREKGDTALAVLSRALGSTLAGEIARFEHDIGRAVTEFDNAAATVPMYTRLDAFGGLSLARFSRAEALFEAGRTDDAIKWYRTLDSDSGGELAFKAAAARGIARCANMLSLSRKPQP